MNGLRTCRTRKSSKKAINTPLYPQSDEILSHLVLRMAKMEQRMLLQRCEIGVLESEIEVLRNHVLI
jgi:hypothetical protein